MAHEASNRADPSFDEGKVVVFYVRPQTSRQRDSRC